MAAAIEAARRPRRAGADGRLPRGGRARGFAEAVEALGGLDLFVNNAGVEEPYELVDMPLESWQKVLDVNLTGASSAAARRRG